MGTPSSRRRARAGVAQTARRTTVDWKSCITDTIESRWVTTAPNTLHTNGTASSKVLAKYMKSFCWGCEVCKSKRVAFSG